MEALHRAPGADANAARRLPDAPRRRALMILETIRRSVDLPEAVYGPTRADCFAGLDRQRRTSCKRLLPRAAARAARGRRRCPSRSAEPSGTRGRCARHGRRPMRPGVQTRLLHVDPRSPGKARVRCTAWRATALPPKTFSATFAIPRPPCLVLRRNCIAAPSEPRGPRLASSTLERNRRRGCARARRRDRRARRYPAGRPSVLESRRRDGLGSQDPPRGAAGKSCSGLGRSQPQDRSQQQTMSLT